MCYFSTKKETNSGTLATGEFNDDGELENWTRLEGSKTGGELRSAGSMDSFSNKNLGVGLEQSSTQIESETMISAGWSSLACRKQ